MKKSGLNLIEVKEYNRALITQLICTNNGTTRNYLTEKSNLTSMTLTNITGELIKKNVIIESDAPKDSKTVGRSPKLLFISPNSPVVAGIFVSKDFLFGSVSDLTLKLITVKRIEFNKNENSTSILEKIGDLANYLLNFTKRDILGLGISVIGVVDIIHGSVKNVTNFFNIKELNIKEYLQNKIDIPIFVKNDMQSSALCEMYYGLGKEISDFIYVGITNGVGSAIVSNRHLFNNSTGSCGELGHMTIDYQGPKCNCGSCGCLELYASVPQVMDRINKECNCNLTDFSKAMDYCLSSPKAYEILEDISQRLAYALNNLINIVDVSTVVFGHSGVLLPDETLNSIAEQINRISIFKYNRKINILKTQFEDNSPIFGSACIVLDQLFTGALPL